LSGLDLEIKREEKAMKKNLLFLAFFLVVMLFVPADKSCAAGNEVFVMDGQYAVPMVGFASTNTSQVFTTAFNTAATTDPDWNKVREVWIQVVTNDVVFAIGADAVNGASQVGFTLYVGSGWRVSGETVRQIRFKSATDDSAGRVIAIPFY